MLLLHSSNAKKKIVCSIGIVYKYIGSYIQIPKYHNLEQVLCLWCGCGVSKVTLYTLSVSQVTMECFSASQGIPEHLSHAQRVKKSLET